MKLASHLLKSLLLCSAIFVLVGLVCGFFYNRQIYLELADREANAQMLGAKAIVLRHYAYGDMIGLRSSLDSLARVNDWTNGALRDQSGEVAWQFDRERSIPRSSLAHQELKKNLEILNENGTPIGEISASINVGLSVKQLWQMLLSFLLPFMSFWILFLATTYFAIKRATKPLQILAQDLEAQAAELDITLTSDRSENEITQVSQLFRELRTRWKESVREALANESLAAQAKIAAQVAHDIRSPLSALNVLSGRLASLPEGPRRLLEISVSRIAEIADGLTALHSSKPNRSSDTATSDMTFEVLGPLVESVLHEKRVQLRHGVEISWACEPSSIIRGVHLNRADFKRVLSNLLNNALESLPASGGRVRVSMESAGKTCRLKIVDDGKGIPDEVLERLGTRGFSFEKPGGSGLGLAHAKECVSLWRGSLTIGSTVDHGSTVTIDLPYADRLPDWFMPALPLADKTEILIVDDDESIHEVWRSRLQGARIIHLFKSGEALRTYLRTSRGIPRLCLIDHEILGSTRNGLEWIKDLNIMKDSVLVTARFEDAEVRQNARALGVRIIPKPLAHLIPIEA